jgi:hypothetical protein
MRSASTADMDAATAEWLARVQSACPEQVLGACRFAPPRSEVGGRAAALGGGLALGVIGRRFVRKAESAGNRRSAGGLPSSFVLAVTPTTVRAYESLLSRSGSDIGPEVAVWDRARLDVLGVDRGGMKTNVRLRLPDGEEIAVAAGSHAYTDGFVALLKSSTIAPA